jgi:REP element-mobilizing transposase RayT
MKLWTIQWQGAPLPLYNGKMKNRDYKEFSAGNFYHIYNRGNNKEKIFFDEQDYRFFLFRLGLALGFEIKELSNNLITSVPYSRIRITGSNRNNFKLHSFCLMPNHFHLLIEQVKNEPISKLILKVCTSYVVYINKKYKRVGHLFQDQYKSVCIEDDSQLMWTAAYIHMNPVKDRIVKSPEKYEWSSYKDYVEERNLPIVHTKFLRDLFGNTKDFETETLRLSTEETLWQGAPLPQSLVSKESISY